MKRLFTCLSLLLGFLSTKADHITGGEMYYTLTGNSGGVYRYSVTLKLFMDCYSNRNLPNPTIIGVFDRVTGARIKDIPVTLNNQDGLNLTNPDPCITNPPAVCYQIGYYNFVVDLPPSANGYLLVCQVVYRVNGINNLILGYGNVGATYTAEIPGTVTVNNGPSNNSARFTGNDMVVICANNAFNYDFGAADSDGDELRYSFCNALQGGIGGGNSSSPASPPPYESVPYGNGYDESTPLGLKVKIDPATGMVSGTAPGEGIYVVTVCVQEVRNGIVIATQRKDLQIRITNCTIASASIPPDYMLCRNTQTIDLYNASNSPLITSNNWEILNQAGNILFSSSAPTASYTFADTGTYLVKLSINRNQQCSDSAESIVRVYPGFIPGFDVNGICYKKPSQFIDATVSQYGQVTEWDWDFGESTSVTDFSSDQHPVFTYPYMGSKPVRLVVTDSKGCRDTLKKDIIIMDKPPLDLAFHDTLICVPDALQLQASGNGLFSWSPAQNMSNGNTATPTVSPISTTTYIVQLDDHGCINRDSVKVRVVDHVTLSMMPDTIICRSDIIRLHLQSDGLQYAWTPAGQVMDAGPNPQVVTYNTTVYTVVATIGSCTATGQVKVSTVPYPEVYAGPDTTICFDSYAQLGGVTNGNIYRWLNVAAPGDPSALQTVVRPVQTTAFVLGARDDRSGCPKPAFDTVLVKVLDDIHPYAGGDTAVVVNQPLQLMATGGIKYRWIPSIGLSNPEAGDPVALYGESTPGIQYKILVFNEAGCVDSTYKRVKVYETRPSVFIPNAFTPNGDGKNDYLRPIAAGIKQIEFFQVYNRYGQLVYRTTVAGENGWDGTVGGKAQQTGTYVWLIKAVDYTGAPYVQRGTVMLIR